jgi:hypothetical protein
MTSDLLILSMFSHWPCSDSSAPLHRVAGIGAQAYGVVVGVELGSAYKTGYMIKLHS